MCFFGYLDFFLKLRLLFSYDTSTVSEGAVPLDHVITAFK
jgi:hypothetical protein